MLQLQTAMHEIQGKILKFSWDWRWNCYLFSFLGQTYARVWYLPTLSRYRNTPITCCSIQTANDAKKNWNRHDGIRWLAKSRGWVARAWAGRGSRVVGCGSCLLKIKKRICILAPSVLGRNLLLTAHELISPNSFYETFNKGKTVPLKCYYDENHIFSIEDILRHKQVACMSRKMLFTTFKSLFLFQRYSSF